MTDIITPEAIAAATLEACAIWIDMLARASIDADEQERLGSLAEALRFDRTSIILAVTKPLEG
ncbi:MAG: hypothetical protein JWQ89_2634 [Devosia sp.]|uniref:hypothetical protein n=1 Tax=Devosia sp. TaxID=1871048 RepID=UPI002619A5E9|nr:hypothetical protein [Devosia sp.]MDB5540907.1 hypothetical protein [Devosia sp.]